MVYYKSQKRKGLGRLFKKTAPNKSPTLLDIAWAAGIFEGEGHTQWRKTTECVVITQKSPWLLRKLRLLFGGHVPHKRPPSHSCYRWYLSGARARGFLMTIYGFLSPTRKRQIRLLLYKGKRHNGIL